MADANRALYGGFFARLRNATEAVIGYDCRAAGYGDTAIVVLREGRNCGSSEKKGREADNGLTHFIPLEGNLRSSHLRSGCRSEEHTSELQSLMRISYAVFCLKKKK